VARHGCRRGRFYHMAGGIRSCPGDGASCGAQPAATGAVAGGFPWGLRMEGDGRRDGGELPRWSLSAQILSPWLALRTSPFHIAEGISAHPCWPTGGRAPLRWVSLARDVSLRRGQCAARNPCKLLVDGTRHTAVGCAEPRASLAAAGLQACRSAGNAPNFRQKLSISTIGNNCNSLSLCGFPLFRPHPIFFRAAKQALHLLSVDMSRLTTHALAVMPPPGRDGLLASRLPSSAASLATVETPEHSLCGNSISLARVSRALLTWSSVRNGRSPPRHT
jgi:hypothetical protein